MGNSSSSTDEIFAEDGETPRLYALAKIKPHQWPVIYSPAYNIGFMGLEKIHPFDSGKWGKVYQNLVGEDTCLPVPPFSSLTVDNKPSLSSVTQVTSGVANFHVFEVYHTKLRCLFVMGIGC